MNASHDWSGISIGIEEGDLVQILSSGYMRMEDTPRWGIVTEVGYPPKGSLQVLKIVVLTSSGTMSVNPSMIEKVA